jgi:hypothetical protein
MQREAFNKRELKQQLSRHRSPHAHPSFITGTNTEIL